MFALRKSGTYGHVLFSQSLSHFPAPDDNGWRAKLRRIKSQSLLQQISKNLKRDSFNSTTYNQNDIRPTTSAESKSQTFELHGCSPSKWAKGDSFMIAQDSTYHYVDPLRSNPFNLRPKESASTIKRFPDHSGIVDRPTPEHIIIDSDMIFGSCPRNPAALARRGQSRLTMQLAMDILDRYPCPKTSPNHRKRMSAASVHQHTTKYERDMVTSAGVSPTKLSIGSTATSLAMELEDFKVCHFEETLFRI